MHRKRRLRPESSPSTNSPSGSLTTSGPSEASSSGGQFTRRHGRRPSGSSCPRSDDSILARPELLWHSARRVEEPQSFLAAESAGAWGGGVDRAHREGTDP